MYEFKGGESERPRFHLTDKEGKVFVRGESASFGGSGETTVVLTCEKNIYYMRFYLYTNTQETWQQQYGLEKVGYSNYA